MLKILYAPYIFNLLIMFILFLQLLNNRRMRKKLEERSYFCETYMLEMSTKLTELHGKVEKLESKAPRKRTGLV